MSVDSCIPISTFAGASLLFDALTSHRFANGPMILIPIAVGIAFSTLLYLCDKRNKIKTNK